MRNLIDKQNELANLREILFKKVKYLLKTSAPGSIEHIHYTFMKAYLFNSIADEVMGFQTMATPVMRQKSLTASNQVLTLIENWVKDEKLAPMVIYPYLVARMESGRGPIGDVLKENEKIYEEYLTKHTHDEAWDGIKTFGINPETCKASEFFNDYHSKRNLRVIMACVGYNLALMNINDADLVLKYGLRTQFMLYKKVQEYTVTGKLKIITFWATMVRYFICKNRLKQANNLLGIAMCQTIKMIRETNVPEDRQMIKKNQCELSVMYALLGKTVATLSLYGIQNSQCDHVKEIMRKSNLETLEDTDLLKENGIEVYLSQVPMQLITDEKAIKKLAEKSLLWCKRATDLNMDASENKTLSTLNMMLNEIVECISQNRRYDYCHDLIEEDCNNMVEFQ